MRKRLCDGFEDDENLLDDPVSPAGGIPHSNSQRELQETVTSPRNCFFTWP